MSSAPEKLYKYCSFKQAKAITESKTFPWCSPACLNDPTQPDHTLDLQITRELILKSAVKISTAMIFAPDNPRGDSPLIAAIKRWRSEERFNTPEEAHQVLKELLSRMVDHRIENHEASVQKWREYVQKIRIANLYASAENLLAWQYCADNHQGVCLHFNSGKNHTFESALPVEYCVSPTELTTLKEQVTIILQGTKDLAQSRFESLVRSRPSQFKFLKEWRCIRETTSPPSDSPEHWVDDIAFNAEELTGMSFGVAISDKNKSEMTKLVKKHFPSIQIYQSQIIKGKYEIEQIKL